MAAAEDHPQRMLRPLATTRTMPEHTIVALIRPPQIRLVQMGDTMGQQVSLSVRLQPLPHR